MSLHDPRSHVHLAVLTLALFCTTPAALSAGSVATCDPARIQPESYRLSTEAQALNVLRPRSRWWDGFLIGKHEDDLADLNETATWLAERAAAVDESNLLAHGALARQYLIAGEPADRVLSEWRRVFDGGGSVVWTATEYEVDARSFFLIAFGRDALRVYRFGKLAGAFPTRLGTPQFPNESRERFWRALAGCIDPDVRAEAVIPWSDVHEIKAGNWVVWIKFRTPVQLVSDRGKRKRVSELKVNLHGATGELTFYYNANDREGRIENVRGISVGPTDYQRHVQDILAQMVDPDKRIKLPRTGRGAGW